MRSAERQIVASVKIPVFRVQYVYDAKRALRLRVPFGCEYGGQLVYDVNFMRVGKVDNYFTAQVFFNIIALKLSHTPPETESVKPYSAVEMTKLSAAFSC